MKKNTLRHYAVGCVFSLLLLASCSGTKESRQMKKSIDGEWTVQTVTVEGISGMVNATVFNEASFKCFIGSVWSFESNNSSGFYGLQSNGKECPAIKRYIRWSIYEPKGGEREFQFKRLDDKKNVMDNGDGYRLQVSMLNETSMQLRSNITFEGKAAAIVYNFSKN